MYCVPPGGNHMCADVSCEHGLCMRLERRCLATHIQLNAVPPCCLPQLSKARAAQEKEAGNRAFGEKK